MKKLWIRIGAEIELPDDFDVSEDTIGELEDIIDEKVTSGQFKVCGETYAPCFEGDEYPMDEKFEYEIIGNIYDNPELLRSDTE